MTRQDFCLLVHWLYDDDAGEMWLAPAARDLRISRSRIKNIIDGDTTLNPELANALCAMVAAHTLLRGWQERLTLLDQLALTDWTRQRIEHHRQHIAQ